MASGMAACSFEIYINVRKINRGVWRPDQKCVDSMIVKKRLNAMIAGKDQPAGGIAGHDEFLQIIGCYPVYNITDAKYFE